MKKTIVVTGAAGFVGSHVARALVARGHRIIATDIAAELPEVVLRGLDTSHVTYVAGDIRSRETRENLVELAGPNVTVVHVAALIRFAELSAALGEKGRSIEDAVEVFEVNSMASWQLCSAFAVAGSLSRFVYVGTRSVFGGLEIEGDVIDETSPQRPIGVYGSSKAAAEIGLLSLRDVFSLDLVVARITGVFGPWQGSVSWIGNAVEGVLSGNGYQVASGSDDRYELTYVKDTVRGLLTLIDADRLEHSIYHVSSGRMHSLGEVAQAFRIADPSATVDFGTGGVTGVKRRLPLGDRRIVEEFGFRAHWDLEPAIADYLSTERSGDYGIEV
jgi:nucleoside-diphosphate-sugar epimerase